MAYNVPALPTPSRCLALPSCRQAPSCRSHPSSSSRGEARCPAGQDARSAAQRQCDVRRSGPPAYPPRPVSRPPAGTQSPGAASGRSALAAPPRTRRAEDHSRGWTDLSGLRHASPPPIGGGPASIDRPSPAERTLARGRGASPRTSFRYVGGPFRLTFQHCRRAERSEACPAGPGSRSHAHTPPGGRGREAPEAAMRC